MNKLMHISASPRGTESQSLALAVTYVEEVRRRYPATDVVTWDLWDGSLPEFGPEAVAAKMAIFGGGQPTGGQVAAWNDVRAAFERFDSADDYLFSVPMWNAGVPYVLKRFIDVVSQPGMAFSFDADHGYTGLLRGKRATVIYTGAVYGEDRSPAFGSDFAQPYFEDWLRWAGVSDIRSVAFRPNLVDPNVAVRRAVAADQLAKLAAEL